MWKEAHKAPSIQAATLAMINFPNTLTKPLTEGATILELLFWGPDCRLKTA